MTAHDAQAYGIVDEVLEPTKLNELVAAQADGHKKK
jgi:hypothetical protein